MRRRAALTALAALACACACEDDAPDTGPVKDAKFGVFFGGQVQARKEIPFELDATKQTHGFRIEFREPLPAPLEVKWELDMPGSSKRVRDEKGRRGEGRITKIDSATARAGSTRFERTLRFEPGDPLGDWHVRVHVGERVAIDRDFTVYSEAARRRARERDAGNR